MCCCFLRTIRQRHGRFAQHGTCYLSQWLAALLNPRNPGLACLLPETMWTLPRTCPFYSLQVAQMQIFCVALAGLLLKVDISQSEGFDPGLQKTLFCCSAIERGLKRGTGSSQGSQHSVPLSVYDVFCCLQHCSRV